MTSYRHSPLVFHSYEQVLPRFSQNEVCRVHLIQIPAQEVFVCGAAHFDSPKRWRVCLRFPRGAGPNHFGRIETLSALSELTPGRRRFYYLMVPQRQSHHL